MSKVKTEIATDELVPLFKSIGLSQAKAQEAAKSPKNATALKNIIENHPVVSNNGLDEKQASLIVTLAGTLVKSSGVGHGETDITITKILDGKLKTADQVAGDFVQSNNVPIRSPLCFDSRCQIHGNSSGAD